VRYSAAIQSLEGRWRERSFSTSAFRDDPETKKYGLWMHGIPYFYVHQTKHWLHISWKRRLADARAPRQRMWLTLQVAKRSLGVCFPRTVTATYS
jgi:hypothetical protein